MAREGPGKRECSANHRRRPWRREATSSGAEDAPDEPDVVEVARQEVLEHHALRTGLLEPADHRSGLFRGPEDPARLARVEPLVAAGLLGEGGQERLLPGRDAPFGPASASRVAVSQRYARSSND